MASQPGQSSPTGAAVPGSAMLALQDGSIFRGTAIGAAGSTSGEVVFNTAMTGYQEILTDPSYAGQIITFTYPHIGNTGTNAEDNESDRVQAAGLVIRDLPLLASNWRNQQPLGDFLRRRNVIGIADIDTRRLTRLLRDRGPLHGAILTAPALDSEVEAQAVALARQFPGLKGMDLACEVSVAEPCQWQAGVWEPESGYRASTDPEGKASRYRVVAYDFGVKHNILRMLVARNCQVTVVPARTPAAEVLMLNPDGVFLSNGPGDPEPCDYAIAAIREMLDHNLPLFGICLGCQLLALACGARTLKMQLGHHGANHPVQNLQHGTVMISSQNHGFAVDPDSLPANLRATHRSLFDGSLQGMECTDKPAFAFQGHPEASPGPHDMAPLFDRFIELMQAARRSSPSSH